MNKGSTNKVKIFVENKNAMLIGGEYIDQHSKFDIKCNIHNYVFNLRWNSIKAGRWCPECNNISNKPINEKDIKNVVESMGYELLNVEKLNRQSRFNVRCDKHDHIWETCYGNMKYEGGKCNLCASGTVDIQTLNNFLKDKQAELLDRKFVEEKGETSGKRLVYVVRCDQGHIFDTNWRNLQRNIWCSKCDDISRTITHEQIKSLVEEKNGLLLDENCKGALNSFKVKCNKCSYEWETTWSRINSGCWCPGCIFYSKDEMVNIVRDHGGELLSDWVSISSKVNIKCDCGNIFNTALDSIIKNCWPCICGKKGQQKWLYEIIKKLYPNNKIEYNFRGFSWLKTNKKNSRPLEIDIWLPEIGLAIEYDGEQHFKPVKFANTMTDEQAMGVFKAIRKRDKKKNKLIAQHTEEIKYFVRFNYKDIINLETVKDRLKENNVPIKD